MSAFNSYTINLNLSTLKEYCIKHGEMTHFSRGDMFEIEGLKSQRIGYVVNGCFKYIVHNNTENRDYITGFSFENEFVCDFPNCMNQQPAIVSIVALENTDVYIINGTELKDIIDNQSRSNIYEHLFHQIYTQYLDTYRMTVRERYINLLHRCPQIVQQINLKDIASFLRVTPTTISNIRREITFES